MIFENADISYDNKFKKNGIAQVQIRNGGNDVSVIFEVFVSFHYFLVVFHSSELCNKHIPKVTI